MRMLGYAYLGTMFAFIFLPVVVLVLFSFQSSRLPVPPFGAAGLTQSKYLKSAGYCAVPSLAMTCRRGAAAGCCCADASPTIADANASPAMRRLRMLACLGIGFRTGLVVATDSSDHTTMEMRGDKSKLNVGHDAMQHRNAA